MTKQDWIEVINATSNRDWMDWLLIVVSVISPIIALVTVIYASKSAKAAEKASNLSLEMYEKQKEDHEKSFLPLYSVEGEVDAGGSSASFELKNENIIPISFIKAKSKCEVNSFYCKKYEKEDILNFTIEQNYNENKEILIEIYYNALNHHGYISEIKLVLKNYDVVIESQINKKV